MSEKRPLKVAVVGMPFRPCRSVLSPTAQTSILCESGTNLNTALDVQVSKYLVEGREPVMIKAIVSLQHQEGLRISEVLGIRPSDVKSGLRIVINGKKGSSDRLVNPIHFRKFWQKYSEGFTNISDIYDRFFMYRLYNRLGFVSLKNGTGKRAVTHVFRHNLIEELDGNKIDRSLIQKHVGHKSARSTEFYLSHGKETGQK